MAISKDAIIVSVRAVDADDPYDIIWSNRTFIDAQLDAGVDATQLAPDAMRSYYVDFYRGEVENGGFSQFVFNTEWDPTVIQYLREGLKAIGAKKNLAMFEQAAAVFESMDEARQQQFLGGEYFGEDKNRDELAAFDEKLFSLFESEDLIGRNSQWLKAHPKLVAVTREEAMDEIQRRVG